MVVEGVREDGRTEDAFCELGALLLCGRFDQPRERLASRNDPLEHRQGVATLVPPRLHHRVTPVTKAETVVGRDQLRRVGVEWP